MKALHEENYSNFNIKLRSRSWIPCSWMRGFNCKKLIILKSIYMFHIITVRIQLEYVL